MTTYALINPDPNNDELGEIISTHQTLEGAGKAWRSMDRNRWAYVAAQRADGSYPHRAEALDLPEHEAAIRSVEA